MILKKLVYIFIFLVTSISIDIKSELSSQHKQNTQVTQNINNNKSSKSSKNIKNNSYIIDKILAIVYHPEGSSIVLQSDLKPGLEGAPRTLHDVVIERLMEFDAKNIDIAITEADVDRHLSQVQKMHNLSQEDLFALFKQMGFSLEEARQQLQKRLIVERVLDYRVKSKAIVGKQELEEYHKQNPFYREASYKVSQAFVPFEGNSPTLKKIKIEQAIENNEIDNIVNWEDPIDLKNDQIAQDKEYIKNLKPNNIVIINSSDQGLVLLKLISKVTRKLLTFEEREMDIMNILGQERFAKVFKAYQDSLFKAASIKYLEN